MYCSFNKKHNPFLNVHVCFTVFRDFSDLNVAIPSKNTADMMVDGVKYSELPICHVNCALNNTIITITDHTGILSLHKVIVYCQGFLYNNGLFTKIPM